MDYKSEHVTKIIKITIASQSSGKLNFPNRSIQVIIQLEYVLNAHRCVSSGAHAAEGVGGGAGHGGDPRRSLSASQCLLQRHQLIITAHLTQARHIQVGGGDEGARGDEGAWGHGGMGAWGRGGIGRQTCVSGDASGLCGTNRE